MRLLNALSLQLEEFFGDDPPPYAILSHRWQADEVLFRHIQNGSAPEKKAYAKLKLCCNQAIKDGLDYMWVDTCCIDKGSSAELTEAINSMFRWYQNAAVCYAYLSDVESTNSSYHGGFSKSAWWTRGWTLQELIAPSRVEFYSASWENVGTKESLKSQISSITGIDMEALMGKDLQTFSVAKKMSWGSKRSTTRIEDVAYSLLGIFGVNMPLLYGEGQKAFLRLQEEILKQSDDQSLFAWSCSDTSYRGMLAKSPAYFSNCSKIVRSAMKLGRAPYTMTNMGLSIELFMAPWAMETYLVLLDCETDGVSEARKGIFLKLLPEQDQYARVMVNEMDIVTCPPELLAEGTYMKIYVRQQIWGTYPSMDRKYGFWVRSVLSTKGDESLKKRENIRLKGVNSRKWSEEKRILEIPTGFRGTAGGLRYLSADLGTSFLLLGFDACFNPVCSLEGPLWERSAVAPVKEWGTTSEELLGLSGPPWMHVSSPNVHKGSRLKGLCRYSGCIKISIHEEMLENQKIWAVDIEHYDSKNPLWEHVRCDECSDVRSHNFPPSLDYANQTLENIRTALQMSYLS
jgi:hypothetical protein